MTHQEREFALEQMKSSEAQLLASVDGLTSNQWAFRESEERWSIAENIEHLIVFERFILARIHEALSVTADPEKRIHAAAKEPLVRGLAAARHTRFNARDAVLPTGRWRNPEGMMEELRKARAATVDFVATTQLPLRDHFFPHIAFGDLDCYQWLVVIGQHGARHALQVEEVKAHPSYPVP